MTKRLLASIIILMSILFLPYWFYLPMIFIAILILPFYWEALVWAYLIDVLYGEGVALVPSLLVLAVFASVIAMMFFRERIRIYV